MRQHALALVALFVALGGTGYAASVAHNSVGSGAIKNNAIRSRDVRDDALTGADINESSLTLPQGPVGPAGPAGPTGQDGAAGLAGPAGTAGQSATTVLGTGQLQVTPTTNYTLIPGLTQTVNVPAGARVYVSTDGGIQNTGMGTTFTTVDIALFVDGSLSPAQRRIVAANTTGVAQMLGNWSFGTDLLARRRPAHIRDEGRRCGPSSDDRQRQQFGGPAASGHADGARPQELSTVSGQATDPDRSRERIGPELAVLADLERGLHAALAVLR